MAKKTTGVAAGDSEAIRIYERMEEERQRKAQAKAEANKPKKVTRPVRWHAGSPGKTCAPPGPANRTTGAQLPKKETPVASRGFLLRSSRLIRAARAE